MVSNFYLLKNCSTISLTFNRDAYINTSVIDKFVHFGFFRLVATTCKSSIVFTRNVTFDFMALAYYLLELSNIFNFID
jgi:hypothetical protein